MIPSAMSSLTKRATSVSAVIVGTWIIVAMTSDCASDGARASARPHTGDVSTLSPSRCTGGYVK